MFQGVLVSWEQKVCFGCRCNCGCVSQSGTEYGMSVVHHDVPGYPADEVKGWKYIIEFIIPDEQTICGFLAVRFHVLSILRAGLDLLKQVLILPLSRGLLLMGFGARKRIYSFPSLSITFLVLATSLPASVHTNLYTFSNRLYER